MPTGGIWPWVGPCDLDQTIVIAAQVATEEMFEMLADLVPVGEMSGG
jgi:hypothetical protein